LEAQTQTAVPWCGNICLPGGIANFLRLDDMIGIQETGRRMSLLNGSLTRYLIVTLGFGSASKRW
jgi:hypothetical protein